jgi:hypothetical protein
MNTDGTTGRESTFPTRTQATLDTWLHVQNSRRRLLRRGYRSAGYSNNPIIPQSTTHPNRRGTQLRIDDYIGYNESAQSWVNSPAPINENETWRIAGGDSNGIKPYGDMKELIPIVEHLRNLQAGGILLNETNVEWHKWEHRDNAEKLLRNTFGSVNENRAKPGGTLTAAVGDWSHIVVKTGIEDTGCGRWSYITLARKEDKFLTLVSTFRVCDQTNPGNTTASAQQYKIKYEDEELRPFLLSPHWQTLIDMDYFVKDLKDANHEVLIFMDANENETHRFQAQTHDVKSVTKHGFHVDGSIDGSLHTFMRNCGLLNVIKELK